MNLIVLFLLLEHSHFRTNHPMLYRSYMYQHLIILILTLFFVLQLYESVNFRHMSKYIIVWPWMTLDFIHRHWTWVYDIGDILSFNLSGHMMTCVVSSWFYITLHFAPCLSLDVLIFHIWPVLEWTSLAYFYSWSIHIFPKTA